MFDVSGDPASTPGSAPSGRGDRADRVAEHAGIVTPEAVVLDLETAGFASRAAAGAIDLALQVVVLFATVLVVGSVLAGDLNESTGTTLLAFVTFGILFGYPIVCETWWRGRTPGKAALRLRAVTVDGAPIHLREATLRSMGGIVDRLLPPGGITGVLLIIGTPRHQRIGDLVAGTIVIRDPRQYVPAPALWFSAPWGLEEYAEAIDPSAITSDQYTVLRSFLTRVDTLSPSARQALAADLADRLSHVVGFPRHEGIEPEAYLLCVISRYQRSVGPASPLCASPS